MYYTITNQHYAQTPCTDTTDSIVSAIIDLLNDSGESVDRSSLVITPDVIRYKDEVIAERAPQYDVVVHNDEHSDGKGFTHMTVDEAKDYIDTYRSDMRRDGWRVACVYDSYNDREVLEVIL